MGLPEASIAFGNFHRHLANFHPPASPGLLGNDGNWALNEQRFASPSRDGYGVNRSTVGSTRRRLFGCHRGGGRAHGGNFAGFCSYRPCIGHRSRPTVTGCGHPTASTFRTAFRPHSRKLRGYDGSSPLFGGESSRRCVDGLGIFIPPNWYTGLWIQLPERRAVGYALRPGRPIDGRRGGQQLFRARVGPGYLRARRGTPLQTDSQKDCGIPSGPVRRSISGFGIQRIGPSSRTQDSPGHADTFRPFV